MILKFPEILQIMLQNVSGNDFRKVRKQFEKYLQTLMLEKIRSNLELE